MKIKNATLISLATILGATLAAEDFDANAAWEKDCQKCHAADGSGLTKKGRKLHLKDYRKTEVQAEMSDEDITAAIKDGIKKDGEFTMNAFGEDYTDEQIAELLAYVRSLKE